MSQPPIPVASSLAILRLPAVLLALISMTQHEYEEAVKNIERLEPMP